MMLMRLDAFAAIVAVLCGYRVSEKPSTIDSSSPDLSPMPATNDKAIATGAKPRSVNLIIMSVG
jgi:hypothetical protein